MLELEKIGGPLGAAVHTISITLNTRTPAAQMVVAGYLGIPRSVSALVIIWELPLFCQSTKVLACCIAYWPRMPDSANAAAPGSATTGEA